MLKLSLKFSSVDTAALVTWQRRTSCKVIRLWHAKDDVFCQRKRPNSSYKVCLCEALVNKSSPRTKFPKLSTQLRVAFAVFTTSHIFLGFLPHVGIPRFPKEIILKPFLIFSLASLNLNSFSSSFFPSPLYFFQEWRRKLLAHSFIPRGVSRIRFPLLLLAQTHPLISVPRKERNTWAVAGSYVQEGGVGGFKLS